MKKFYRLIRFKLYKINYLQNYLKATMYLFLTYQVVFNRTKAPEIDFYIIGTLLTLDALKELSEGILQKTKKRLRNELESSKQIKLMEDKMNEDNRRANKNNSKTSSKK